LRDEVASAVNSPREQNRMLGIRPLQYELHKYLDNQGRSGDSLRAKVTSSLG